MTYLSHRLSNGIRIIHKPTDSYVAHCGLTINAGSRDEEANEQGLAHFIEHVIFKGTQKRRSHHILSHMENVGGELNAYTTKEDTCIHASFMNNFYPRWFDLLSDILFNSTFPEKELKKEKDIIIDEINSYKDNPSEQIFDDFDGLVFGDHPLGRNILGIPKYLKTFNQSHIQRFMERTYATEEMVICSVGRIPFADLIRLTEKYFGHAPQGQRQNQRLAVNHYQPVEKVVNRRNHQAHCVLGSPAYHADHSRKTALILLNNMLGGPGLNSRLNMAVREKHGFCYNIESHYLPYSDTGTFCLYFGTEAGYIEKTLSLIRKELNRFRNESLGLLQLKRAKQQLIGQVAISFESNMAEMLSMGKSILLYDKVETIEEINRKIEAVTAAELLETANEIFDPERLSMLTFKPR
ncbi:MAG: pitrilysin family protein [Bacteroides sp.]|jgi:predicted Zn-dependent peptidase|nr:pitrilysin family protein [Bacteroides sp.]